MPHRRLDHSLIKSGFQQMATQRDRLAHMDSMIFRADQIEDSLSPNQKLKHLVRMAASQETLPENQYSRGSMMFKVGKSIILGK